MLENKSHIKLELPSDKKFGFVFSFIFGIIGLYLFFVFKKYYIIFFLLSFIILIAALFFSSILELPNKIWMKFGFFLNSIISPIIMFVIFVITFYPIGLALKLFRIDIINLKYNKNLKSYWITRSNEIESLKKLY